jgi:hypothetical protein
VDSCDAATNLCVNTPIVCEDGDACTYEFCEDPYGCIVKPFTCADDGNPCTAGWCDPVTGCQSQDVDCTDGDPCTADRCDPETGACIWTPIDCGGGDADGDGVPDDEDDCPGSCLDPTVVIPPSCAGPPPPSSTDRPCDSGVPNLVLPDGCTIEDEIAECLDSSSSRSRFVKCVERLTKQLRRQHVIKERQRRAIDRCASEHEFRRHRRGHGKTE